MTFRFDIGNRRHSAALLRFMDVLGQSASGFVRPSQRPGLVSGRVTRNSAAGWKLQLSESPVLYSLLGREDFPVLSPGIR